MQEIRQIGNVPWDTARIKESIPEFLDLYSRRPLKDNEGGMLSPHMFAAWFMLKNLNPENVIESGVWKGQGTWLIENTLPGSRIFSIDINLGMRKYISPQARYFSRDFSSIDWDFIKDKNNTVLFFDDHQNAFERLRQAGEMGFKKFIFEDNYPEGQGDCYSLKKAFQHSGFDPGQQGSHSIKSIFKNLLTPRRKHIIAPNSSDAAHLENVLEVYYEFPPVFRSKNTRWGDEWNEGNYPTPEALYREAENASLQLFQQEAAYYTWICFAKLK